MKKLDFKTLLIVTLIPVFVVILYFTKKENKSDQEKQQGKEMILPEVEEGDSLSKTEVYEEAGKPDKKSGKENLSLDDIYKMDSTKNGKKDSSQEEKKVTEIQDGENDDIVAGGNSQRSGSKSAERIKPTRQKSYSSGGSSTEEKSDKSRSEGQEVSVGLGVYENKNISENKENKVVKKSRQGIKMEGFVEARFEKDYVLKEGKEVVLINQEEFEYEGVNVDKFALFFGKVRFNGERFNIRVNTIKNVNNDKYRVDMKVYNTSFQKGLYYDYSESEQSAREVGESGADEVSRDVEQNVVREAIDEVSNSNKPAKIKINEGNLVFVKKNQS